MSKAAAPLPKLFLSGPGFAWCAVFVSTVICMLEEKLKCLLDSPLSGAVYVTALLMSCSLQ